MLSGAYICFWGMDGVLLNIDTLLFSRRSSTSRSAWILSFVCYSVYSIVSDVDTDHALAIIYKDI